MRGSVPKTRKKEVAEMLKRWLIVGVMVAALIGGSVGVVFAEANDKASCIGLDASANAPVNEQIAGIKEIVGIPFGGLVSSVAQLHLGTDEACLAAGG